MVRSLTQSETALANDLTSAPAVTLLYHTRVDGVISPIAFVQVGALLVSSIRATVGVGAHVERGDELGYFAYGGSTIVCIFEEGEIEWDRDLLDNSTGQNEIGEPLETMVKVGLGQHAPVS